MTVVSFPGVFNGPLAGGEEIAYSAASTGDISIQIHHCFSTAEHAWRELESRGALAHAQTFDRSKLWFENVSEPAGASPVIAVGRTKTNELLFVWPFEIVRKRGVRCLMWIGWQHANYQMAPHAYAFAKHVTAKDVSEILHTVAEAVGANAAILNHQNDMINGVPNPFALLPNRPSANTGHAVLLDADFDNLLRNKFSGKSRNTRRRKEKKLQAAGDLTLGWACDNESRHRLLDAFFAQKRQQLEKQGISDAFDGQDLRSFYHALADLPSTSNGRLEIAHVSIDGEPLAISCGVQLGDRFKTMLTSISDCPLSKYSPGELLTQFQIEDCCRRGLNFFDMGAGDAPHKDDWSDIQIPLFDTALAFDEKGYLATLPQFALSHAKRAIKRHSRLWSLARITQRVLFGKSRPPNVGASTQALT